MVPCRNTQLQGQLPISWTLFELERSDCARGQQQNAEFAHCCYSKFWATRCDIGLKTLVFAAIVVSTLTSGLHEFYLTDHELEMMEKCQMRLARKSLAGLACLKKKLDKKTTEFKGVSNDKVRIMLQLSTVKDYLRLSRLKFWQRVAQNPAHHSQLLAAVFGAMPFLSDNIADWKQTTVYKNLKADLLVLDELHIDSFLAEDIGGAPEKIFMEHMHGTDLDLQQRFADARLEESKQKHKKVQFAPPGYVPPVCGGAHPVQLNEWTCDLIVASTGIQCGQKFPSRRRLNIHQSTALCHKKTKPVKGRMFVVSNICPWCNRTFGNVNSARQRVFFVIPSQKMFQRSWWYIS